MKRKCPALHKILLELEADIATEAFVRNPSHRKQDSHAGRKGSRAARAPQVHMTQQKAPMAAFYTGAEAEEVKGLIEAYHYSARMPANIQHCYAVRGPGGLFGDFGDVVAAVIFTLPPTRWREEVLELARLVRHPSYSAPLSRLIAFACSRLRINGWPLAVSFADQTQGHHGGIYQAAGWAYDGQRERAMDGLVIDGQFKPGRSCNSAYGTRSPDKLREKLPDAVIEPHFDEGKHLYWKALTVAGRSKARRLELKAVPYPKPKIAARPSDERLPSRASDVQPVGAAPS